MARFAPKPCGRIGRERRLCRAKAVQTNRTGAKALSGQSRVDERTGAKALSCHCRADDRTGAKALSCQSRADERTGSKALSCQSRYLSLPPTRHDLTQGQKPEGRLKWG